MTTGTITDTSGTQQIVAIYWQLAACSTATIRIHVCAIQTSSGKEIGKPICAPYHSPSGQTQYSDKDTIDVGPFWLDCSSQSQIKFYLQASAQPFRTNSVSILDAPC